MATIKALEGRTVHQIQSGQVIVDLCSVIKELIENSVDAGATSIEVRFKNHGLDAIEVQDNGAGIAPENYESLALKHYTSKLRDYDDLSSLQTFGFRGEALSSLCALSNFHVYTAQGHEAPKGTKLNFESSGHLGSTQVVAFQKGTNVVVENLFANLPVRRRELEKNIKREYGKVLSILQGYACISTNLKLSVVNVMGKGKKIQAFATNSNSSTRENIANVFGSKTLSALVSMDLTFHMDSATTPDDGTDQVRVVGHVSRPTFGEGRNTPDRQLFFVNGRPCILPQFARVFNDVYKSYNVSQSPFIFANIVINTSAYDVNVSPDKRTILLHEQGVLLEHLRTSLTRLFDEQDQTVPSSIKAAPGPANLSRFSTRAETLEIEDEEHRTLESSEEDGDVDEDGGTQNVSNLLMSRPRVSSPLESTNLICQFAERNAQDRRPSDGKGTGVSRSATAAFQPKGDRENPKESSPLPVQHHVANEIRSDSEEMTLDSAREAGMSPTSSYHEDNSVQKHLDKSKHAGNVGIPPGSREDSLTFENRFAPSNIARSEPGVVPNAFDRMRPRRSPSATATVTIGNQTMSAVLGSSVLSKRKRNEDDHEHVSQRMQAFAAPGSDVVKVFKAPLIPRVRRSPSGEDEVSPSIREQSPSESDAEHFGEEGPTDGNCYREDGHSEEDQSSQDSHDNDSVNDGPDSDYVDEDERKQRDHVRVAELIKQAEDAADKPQLDLRRRAHQLLKGVGTREQTHEVAQVLKLSIDALKRGFRGSATAKSSPTGDNVKGMKWGNLVEEPIDESRTALVIEKDDFAAMHIVGQFNLGFILATRRDTDLFIIDQHASDEKFNFERLQDTTIVQNQRLVHPHQLELTAVDEEIILENNDALIKSGFDVHIDTSGTYPVGQRCKLLSLPMSKNVTFNISDLEELLSLLAEDQSAYSAQNIPRPGKIRRMFAMRACRSSIMIGKTLTKNQMKGVVTRMGQIDKPWNCPHGRPTMRHVCGLREWKGWREGDGLVGLGPAEEAEAEERGPRAKWTNWIRAQETRDQDDENENEDEDEQSEATD